MDISQLENKIKPFESNKTHVESDALSFSNFTRGVVNQRTGAYSFNIPLFKLNGNKQKGPVKEISLKYGYFYKGANSNKSLDNNFNSIPFETIDSVDEGFGLGWTLGLTKYVFGITKAEEKRRESDKSTLNLVGKLYLRDGRIINIEEKLDNGESNNQYYHPTIKTVEARDFVFTRRDYGKYEVKYNDGTTEYLSSFVNLTGVDNEDIPQQNVCFLNKITNEDGFSMYFRYVIDRSYATSYTSDENYSKNGRWILKEIRDKLTSTNGNDSFRTLIQFNHTLKQADRNKKDSVEISIFPNDKNFSTNINLTFNDNNMLTGLISDTLSNSNSYSFKYSSEKDFVVLKEVLNYGNYKEYIIYNTFLPVLQIDTDYKEKNEDVVNYEYDSIPAVTAHYITMYGPDQKTHTENHFYQYTQNNFMGYDSKPHKNLIDDGRIDPVYFYDNSFSYGVTETIYVDNNFKLRNIKTYNKFHLLTNEIISDNLSGNKNTVTILYSYFADLTRDYTLQVNQFKCLKQKKFIYSDNSRTSNKIINYNYDAEKNLLMYDEVDSIKKLFIYDTPSRTDIEEAVDEVYSAGISDLLDRKGIWALLGRFNTLTHWDVTSYKKYEEGVNLFKDSYKTEFIKEFCINYIGYSVTQFSPETSFSNNNFILNFIGNYIREYIISKMFSRHILDIKEYSYTKKDDETYYCNDDIYKFTQYEYITKHLGNTNVKLLSNVTEGRSNNKRERYVKEVSYAYSDIRDLRTINRFPVSGITKLNNVTTMTQSFEYTNDNNILDISTITNIPNSQETLKISKKISDCNGLIISETDPTGIITEYSYDSLGRITAITKAAEQKVKYQYVNDGTSPLGGLLVVREITPDNVVKETFFDGWNNPCKVTINGNVISKKDFNTSKELLLEHTYDYNVPAINRRSRVIKTTKTNSYYYDNFGINYKVDYEDGSKRNSKYDIIDSSLREYLDYGTIDNLSGTYLERNVKYSPSGKKEQEIYQLVNKSAQNISSSNNKNLIYNDKFQLSVGKSFYETDLPRSAGVVVYKRGSFEFNSSDRVLYVNSIETDFEIIAKNKILSLTLNQADPLSLKNVLQIDTSTGVPKVIKNSNQFTYSISSGGLFISSIDEKFEMRLRNSSNIEPEIKKLIQYYYDEFNNLEKEIITTKNDSKDTVLERTYTYDGFDRITSITEKEQDSTKSRNISYTYSPYTSEPLKTSISIDNKIIGSRIYDALGRLLSETVGGNNSKRFEYSEGYFKPSRVTTPKGDVISYEYIDKMDYILSNIKFNAKKISYTYDPKTQLCIGKTYADDNSSFKDNNYYSANYDSIGNLTNETFSSDNINRNNIIYKRGIFGTVKNITNNDSSNSANNTGYKRNYYYNEKGQVERIEDGSLRTNIRYNNGLPDEIEFNMRKYKTKCRCFMYYDEIGREYTRVYKINNKDLCEILSTYNNDGKIAKKTIKYNGKYCEYNYAYDVFGRLITAEIDSNSSKFPTNQSEKNITKFTYEYDNFDNITSSVTYYTDGTNTSKTFNYDTSNPLKLISIETTSGGNTETEQVKYDNSGNISKITNSKDNLIKYFSYDEFELLNKITETSNTSATKAYAYKSDFDGKQYMQIDISKDSSITSENIKNINLYSDNKLFASLAKDVDSESKTSNTQNNYIDVNNRIAYTTQLIENPNAYTLYSALISDNLGTAYGKINLNDKLNAKEVNLYNPYGASDPNNNFDIQFAGEKFDKQSGLYHLGNGYRAYDPILMRFLQPDNLSPFDGGGINPYAYCLGDPVNYIDPSGHISDVAISAIVLSIFGLGLSIFSFGSGLIAAGSLAAYMGTAGGILSTSALALEVTSLATGIASSFVDDSDTSYILNAVSFATGLGSMAGGGVSSVMGLSKVAENASKTFFEFMRGYGLGFMAFSTGAAGLVPGGALDARRPHEDLYDYMTITNNPYYNNHSSMTQTLLQNGVLSNRSMPNSLLAIRNYKPRVK